MAKTPEAKVKAKVVEILKAAGMYYFFPVTGGYGKSGVADIIVCWDGRFVAIECKAGNKKPTALQKRELDRVVAAGGIAMVINENDLPAMTRYFKQ